MLEKREYKNVNKKTERKINNTFINVLGRSILAEDLTPIKEYNPSVLTDNTINKAYIEFGYHRWKDPYYYMVTKLNEDIIYLSETTKETKF